MGTNLPEIESANQRYIEIKEQLSQNSKKAVEQKRSVRQWALQLIQLQNNSGQLNLDENDDWDKYLEKNGRGSQSNGPGGK